MLVAGAGGFAIQLLDVLEQLTLKEEIVFFDDYSASLPDLFFNKYKIVKSLDDVSELFKSNPVFALGTGNPQLRRSTYDRISAIGGICKSIISPTAIIGKNEIEIEEGCTLLTGVVVESGVHIGRGSLLNINTIVTHQSQIGAFCELGPGAILCGNCSIGNNTQLGAGAIILPGVHVGNNCVVAAGAVVTKNISDNTKVVGVPAKAI